MITRHRFPLLERKRNRKTVSILSETESESTPSVNKKVDSKPINVKTESKKRRRRKDTSNFDPDDTPSRADLDFIATDREVELERINATPSDSELSVTDKSTTDSDPPDCMVESDSADENLSDSKKRPRPSIYSGRGMVYKQRLRRLAKKFKRYVDQRAKEGTESDGDPSEEETEYVNLLNSNDWFVTCLTRCRCVYSRPAVDADETPHAAIPMDDIDRAAARFDE